MYNLASPSVREHESIATRILTLDWLADWLPHASSRVSAGTTTRKPLLHTSLPYQWAGLPSVWKITLRRLRGLTMLHYTMIYALTPTQVYSLTWAARSDYMQHANNFITSVKQSWRLIYKALGIHWVPCHHKALFVDGIGGVQDQ